MRRYSILLALAFLSACSDSTSPDAIPADCLTGTLLNGIIAFYPFSNGSLSDESGNGYNLINPTAAAPGPDRSGNPGCAYQFNEASDDYLTFVNPSFLNDLPSNFTISFWFKSHEETNDLAILLSRGTETICTNTTGQWSVQFINRSLIFGANGYITATMYEPQQWHHVVVSSTNSSVSLFLDGTELTNGNPYCTTPDPTQNSGDFYIGKFLDGLIDDIIIYDRSLTASEISQLQNLAPCCN